MKNKFPCLVCDKNTLNDIDDYSVYDDIWIIANPDWYGHLCLHCLRKRLGRNLKLSDFMHEFIVNNHITQEFLDEVNDV